MSADAICGSSRGVWASNIVPFWRPKSRNGALRERILAPLGMVDTGYDHHGTVLERRAAGYVRTGTGFRNADYLDMSIPYAAGALYSTVEFITPDQNALEDIELDDLKTLVVDDSSQIRAALRRMMYSSSRVVWSQSQVSSSRS